MRIENEYDSRWNIHKPFVGLGRHLTSSVLRVQFPPKGISGRAESLARSAGLNYTYGISLLQIRLTFLQSPGIQTTRVPPRQPVICKWADCPGPEIATTSTIPSGLQWRPRWWCPHPRRLAGHSPRREHPTSLAHFAPQRCEQNLPPSLKTRHTS